MRANEPPTSGKQNKPSWPVQFGLVWSALGFQAFRVGGPPFRHRPSMVEAGEQVAFYALSKP